jgi:hypothetical protein
VSLARLESIYSRHASLGHASLAGAYLLWGCLSRRASLTGMYLIGVHLIGARSCSESSGEGEAAEEEGCPGEEGRAGGHEEGGGARRKREERRARKEAKEAETAAIWP